MVLCSFVFDTDSPSNEQRKPGGNQSLENGLPQTNLFILQAREYSLVPTGFLAALFLQET